MNPARGRGSVDLHPMALHVLPILKALAPLVANAGALLVNARSTEAAGRTEDRLRKLEEETVRAGEVLTGVTQQLQALAQVNAALERKVRTALVLAVIGLCLGLAGLVVAMVD